MRQFSSWYPLTEEGIREHAPDVPAAIQLRREEGLIDDEGGQSAMVCYIFASGSARDTLMDSFEDEATEPGVRGQGPLEFRYIESEGESTKDYMAELIYKFVRNFGETPLFNRQPEE